MFIKVCGMKQAANILEVAALRPDMMGFIFYSASPRYAGELNEEVIRHLPPSIRRVGVFVNETEKGILEKVERYNITVLQLHGDESAELCRKLHLDGLQVIKAMGINTVEDLKTAEQYQASCDMLLFDTKSRSYGGTGRGFDWNILKHYDGKLPFMLSGGISTTDLEKLINFNHPRFAGVDLNSCFEITPGAKDVSLLRHFIDTIRKKTK